MYRKCSSAVSSWLRQTCPVLQCSPPNHRILLSTRTDNFYVSPRVGLFDQKIHIRVHGLPVNAKITLHAWTQQMWRRKPAVFASCSHFATNDKGELDLNEDASLGGTYTGVDPMGPFWSMRPCPSGPQNVRMVLRNGDDPVLYTLSLFQGHWSLSDLVAKETTLKPLSSTMVTRLKRAADVRRIPVKEGGVRGVLFLPPGEGPHPGVIDMYGSAGGLMETRAALLASHGFAVLALAFFNFQDLPDNFEDITFDYFEEAASWLSSHTAVKDHGIGVVSISKGAEYALLMAWKCPQVKAAVIMNSQPGLSGCDVYSKDGTLVCKAVRQSAKSTKNDPRIKNWYPVPTDYFIPVWESSARILMLVCDDDDQMDPEPADLHHSFYPKDKRHLMEVVHYPGAGHLLEPPYIPHCRSCFSPFFGVEVSWGGNPADHAAAQEKSWHRMITFLRTHLS